MLTTSTTIELPPVHERNRAPTHPGAIIKHECMEPLSLSVTALAEALGVSRKTVSKIVNERGAVTAEMADRASYKAIHLCTHYLTYATILTMLPNPVHTEKANRCMESEVLT